MTVLVFLETTSTGQKEMGRVQWDGKTLTGPQRLIDMLIWPHEPSDTEAIAKAVDGAQARFDGTRVRVKASGTKGGPGSGYHAPHSGRPGQLGGSAPRGRRAEFVGIGSWFLRTGTLGVVYPASVDGQWEFHRLEDDEVFTINDEDLEIEEKGSPKSGYHGHAGRPGKVGGSVPSGRAPDASEGRTPTRPSEKPAEPETRVGITSARPDKTQEQIDAELADFRRRMEEANIKNFHVIMGRGGWEGGGEATWVTSYDGNGEAKRIIIETAKQYDQDAVLFMYRAEQGEGATPKTSFNFGGILSNQETARVEQELLERGVGGWTWYNGPKGSTLMVACVTDWDSGCAGTHTPAMTNMTVELQGSGYQVDSQGSWLNTEVIDRDGYDEFLSVEA